MTERSDLLASIANTVKDYRAGEIPEPTPDHVDRWIRQFDNDVQVPMLRELEFVLKRTYVSKAKAEQLFKIVIDNLSCDFWRNAYFLDIQHNGSSQSEIIEIIIPILKEKCGTDITNQSVEKRDFIYFDDAIFTGDRAISDISSWIDKEAPNNARVHIMVIAAHEYGFFQIDQGNPSFGNLKSQRLTTVRIRLFNEFKFENRRAYRDQSDVLWPVEGVYDAESFQPRTPRRQVSRFFSSEQGRQLLEREFFQAGVRIREFANNPSPRLKPLGFSSFEPGFGSLFVTFRNCPNNCPLALWYGDPSSYSENHPLGRWYPLLPRKGYSQ